MSLNQIVNSLVRAAAAIPNEISDADLDRHVAKLLANEAKAKEKSWSELGLGAYLGRSEPDPNAPKPNKRFLAAVIRNVDGHNASVLRAQAQGVQSAREERRGEGSRAAMAASRLFGGAMKGVERNGPGSGSRARVGAGADKRDERGSRRDDRDERLSKVKGRYRDDRDTRDQRAERDYRSHGRYSDRRDKREEDEERLHRRSHRHEEEDTRHKRSHREGGSTSAKAPTKDEGDRDDRRLRRHRSRSRERRRGDSGDRDTDHRKTSNRARRRDKSRSRSESPRQSRDDEMRSRSSRSSRHDDVDRNDRDRYHEARRTKRDSSQSPHRSDDKSREKRNERENRYEQPKPRPPTPPPPPPDVPPPPSPDSSPPPIHRPSKMDKYFNEDYDPRLDLSEVPREGPVLDVGWDNMLAILKERGQKRRQQSPGLFDDEPAHRARKSLRAPSPGIDLRKYEKAEKAEKKRKKDERKKRRGDSDESDDERQRRKEAKKREEAGATKDGEGEMGLLNMTYTKAGGTREWDVGK